MPINIDELQIEINAKAVKANDAIDKLVSKLDVLSTSLGRIDGSKITGLANGVDKLGRAMQVMNTVKTTDFTRLATNIQKLSNINTAGLNNSASALSQITRAFNNLGVVSGNAQQVGELASNLSRLGYRSVTNAITNIPQLATALDQLMITLSRSPQVSQNIIDMTNALANLSAQSRSVGTTSNAIVNGMNNTDRAMRKSSKSAKSLASAFGRFYASYFLVVRGIKSLYGAIESTADYIEAYNYYNVSFGKIASEWSQDWEKYGYENAESYSESFTERMNETLGKLSGVQVDTVNNRLIDSGMKNLGLNIQEITQYASQLASVTNSLGQSGESTLAIAQSMTKLAGDISSLFNVDYSAVAKNLQSGLIGQSRALYKYGIDITNATLQTYAYELGLTKAVSEMTQMEKQQLRVLAILDQSKVSWGDLANTIESPSNMIRQLTTNLNESGMVLGQLFIPLMSKILPLANGATIALKRLLVEIAGFFGVEIDLDKFGQGYNDLEDELGDITDGYDNLTDAVNEYQNQLLGFDEVTRLSEDTSISLGDVTGGEIDLTDKIVSATEEYERVWNEAFANMENSSLKWADAIGSAFDTLTDYLEPITNFRSEDLENFYNSFLNPLGSWTLGTGLPQLANIFEDFMDDVDWDTIADGLLKIYTGIEPFAEGIGQGLIDLVNVLADVGAMTLNLIGDGLNAIGDGLSIFGFDNIKKVGEFLTVTLVPAFVTFKGMTMLGNTLTNIGTGWSKMLSLLKGHPYATIAGGIAGLTTAIVTYVQDTYNSLEGTKLKEAADKFADSVAVIDSSVKTSLQDIDAEHKYYSDMANKYVELSDNYSSLTSEEKTLLKEYADELSAYTTGDNSIQSMVDKVTGAWTGTKEQIHEAIDAQSEFYKQSIYESAMKDYSLAKYNAEIEAQLALEPALEQADILIDAVNSRLDNLGKRTQKNWFATYLSDALAHNDYEKYLDTVLEWANRYLDDLNPGAGNRADIFTWLEYNDDVKNLEGLTEAWETYKSVADESAEKIAIVEKALKDLYDTSNEGAENMTNDFETAFTTGVGGAETFEKAFDNMTDETEAELDALMAKFAETNDKSKLTADASGVEKGTDTASKAIKEVTRQPYRASLTLDNLNFINSLSGAETTAKNFKNNYGNLKATLNIDTATVYSKLNEVQTFWDSAVKGMGETKPTLDVKVQLEEAKTKIKSFVDDTAKQLSTISPGLSLIDPLGWGKLNFAGKFANGGFVSAGQVFVARETGPELVGTMGGRTAVANNDQITQGIAQAVYNAFTSALATTNTNSSGDIVINIDGKQVFKAVQRQATNYVAQTGQLPFPI